MSGCMISPPIELHHCECENLDRACCLERTFRLPQKRHTLNQMIAEQALDMRILKEAAKGNW